MHYTVHVGLVGAHLVDVLTASAAGFAAGTLLNYGVSAAVIFRGVRGHRQTLWRFLTVAVVGLGLKSVMVAAATRSLGLHYLLAQISATGVVLLWTFSGNRWWTFAEET